MVLRIYNFNSFYSKEVIIIKTVNYVKEMELIVKIKMEAQRLKIPLKDTLIS